MKDFNELGHDYPGLVLLIGWIGGIGVGICLGLSL